MTTIDLAAATTYNDKHRDAETEKAIALLVARWQEEAKIGVDGKLGPMTQKTILATLGQPAIDPELLEGDHNEVADQDAAIAIDAEGWATGDDVFRIPSARSQNLVSRDGSGPAPAGVVWHWTATGAGSGWACARRIAQSPRPGERSASWHTLITRKGEILCSVPFRRGSWHAGGTSAARFALIKKQWKIKAGSTTSANSIFCGIELENVGEVREVSGAWSGWPFGKDGQLGPIVPEAETAMFGGKKRYQAFTEAQETAARRLLRALVVTYGIDRDAASWGHVDIDPTRKIDPGPLWKKIVLPRILDAVFGKA